MMDYTVSDSEREDFILNYEVSDGFMYVKYANGDLSKYLYNKDLERDILNKMKKQILMAKEKEGYWNNKKLINVILWSVSGFSAFMGFLLYFLPSSVFSIYLLFATLIAGLNIGCIRLDSIKKKDYLKNLLLVENMELFQKGISEDFVMSDDLSKESQKLIDEVKGSFKYQGKDDLILNEPTLNTIDKYSFDDVMDVHNILVKNRDFSNIYEGEIFSSKNNVKKRALTK